MDFTNSGPFKGRICSTRLANNHRAHERKVQFSRGFNPRLTGKAGHQGKLSFAYYVQRGDLQPALINQYIREFIK